MKKVIVLILAALPLLSYGQLKVVERSERRFPSWIGAAGEGFVTSNGVGKSLDEAKNIAMDDIRKQIIESVALNISSQTSNVINQSSSHGGSVDAFKEDFNSRFATQAAKLPFVKGISANKVESFYWEKRQDKKTGDVEYGYSIKYPYSRGEQMQLVRQFEKLDAEMEAKLVGVENVIDIFTTTEELDKAVGEIPVLQNYFFDEVRLSRTKAAKSALFKQYDYIKPIVGVVRKGEAYSTLTVGERAITTTQKPIVKSNCATQIEYMPVDGQIKIKYNDEGCVDDEDNFLEVSYRFNNKVVKEQVFFDINSEKLQASVQGDLRFDFEKSEVVDSLSGVKVSMTIAVNNIGAVLESATFNIPTVKTPIVIKGCDVEFNGAGVYPVEISNQQSYKTASLQNELPIAKAVLYLRNKITGTLQSVLVTVKYTTNLN